jgi:hypothetical protein
MAVCKYWPEKVTGRKRYYDDSLDERVFKDGDLVPDAPVLKEAKDDPLIQFLQGKGFSRLGCARAALETSTYRAIAILDLPCTWPPTSTRNRLLHSVKRGARSPLNSSGRVLGIHSRVHSACPSESFIPCHLLNDLFIP